MLTFVAIATVTAGVPLLVLAAQQRQRRPGVAPRLVFDWNDLQARYAPTDAAALTGILVLAGLMTLGFTATLTWVATLHQAALPAGIYQTVPRLTWISFPATFHRARHLDGAVRALSRDRRSM